MTDSGGQGMVDIKSSKRKSKKRKVSKLSLHGGYVINEKLATILASSDALIDNIASDPHLSTSSLLHIQGYGSR